MVKSSTSEVNRGEETLLLGFGGHCRAQGGREPTVRAATAAGQHRRSDMEQHSGEESS
jgi:hypothetical protein